MTITCTITVFHTERISLVSAPPQRIAIVVPDLSQTGGLRTVAQFLHNVIESVSEHKADLISVALSSSDRASVRALRPQTWRRGVQVLSETDGRRTYRHVGARWAEVEYCRYQPRPALTKRLNPYDLVQVVAGTPAWAQLCRDVACPVALQVATLTREERAAAFSETGSATALWRRLMAHATDRLDHRALQHADVAFVENAWMRDHLTKHMGADRVVFAPPGVDTERFVPGPPPADGEYILCVGRLADRRKNICLLFEAYARLREDHGCTHPLVIAGLTGPPEEAWDYAESAGIRDHITFHEAVPVDDLPGLYQSAAVYAVSSDEEGLGLTVLEAMASGRPVVSTNCGGPATTVVEGETGFLTPVGDADALATAIATVLASPERANAMGKAGRKRAEDHFSLTATGQRFLDTYDQLLTRAS